MITRSLELAKRLYNKRVGSPLVKRGVRFMKQLGAEEAGITFLETALILIAFVVVASIFAFTMLSRGTFSTEPGKEAIHAGLTETQSSMEIKGGVIAIAKTTGSSGTVDSLVFTIANALTGEAVNLATGELAEIAFEYRDNKQNIALGNTDWAVTFPGHDNGNSLLEVGELAEVTVQLTDAINTPLTTNTTFVLEMTLPDGTSWNVQRTTPAWLDAVNDLR